MKPYAAIAVSAAILLCAQASADDWKGQSVATKRQVVSQVVDCMRKRMSSDRVISYNQAAKTCKDEVNQRFANASAGPLVAVDTSRKLAH